MSRNPFLGVPLSSMALRSRNEPQNEDTPSGQGVSGGVRSEGPGRSSPYEPALEVTPPPAPPKRNPQSPYPTSSCRPDHVLARAEIPYEDHKALMALAHARGVGPSILVREAVRRYLAELATIEEGTLSRPLIFL
jgi:hypothetical protein